MQQLKLLMLAIGLCEAVAVSGSVEVLECLQQQGFLISTALISQMLDMAACHNKLAAAQWLKEHGAERPTAFGLRDGLGEVLAWARAKGCATSITPLTL
jgi:hypothetical protein